MDRLNLEDVKAWVWKKHPLSGRRVPVVSDQEREIWRLLSDRKRHERLARDDFLLWSALDRKCRYTGEPDGGPPVARRRVDWGQRNLERTRERYGRDPATGRLKR